MKYLNFDLIIFDLYPSRWDYIFVFIIPIIVLIFLTDNYIEKINIIIPIFKRYFRNISILTFILFFIFCNSIEIYNSRVLLTNSNINKINELLIINSKLNNTRVSTTSWIYNYLYALKIDEIARIENFELIENITILKKPWIINYNYIILSPDILQENESIYSIFMNSKYFNLIENYGDIILFQRTRFS
ncbi:MAG: hypothetical protein ACTSRP_25935 [Candidatus Helarchaeota archaeon]